MGGISPDLQRVGGRTVFAPEVSSGDVQITDAVVAFDLQFPCFHASGVTVIRDPRGLLVVDIFSGISIAPGFGAGVVAFPTSPL
jgi:hypothetical protein